MAVLCQMMNGVAVNNYRVDKQLFKIGRSPENDIHIEEHAVSSEHAVIEAMIQDGSEDVEFHIKDLDSTNRTQVNGEEITSCRLKHNDLVRIGFTVFKFIDEGKSKLEDTVKIKKTLIPGVYVASRKK